MENLLPIRPLGVRGKRFGNGFGAWRQKKFYGALALVFFVKMGKLQAPTTRPIARLPLLIPLHPSPPILKVNFNVKSQREVVPTPFPTIPPTPFSILYPTHISHPYLPPISQRPSQLYLQPLSNPASPIPLLSIPPSTRSINSK